MKVRIRQISDKADECLIIECVEVTPDIESIRSYALAKGMTLIGSIDERIYQFNLSDVFYFEAVDERVFAYTKGKSYELKIRLYELENAYADKHFIRCSKSFIINLMKLESISPALNGRFMAHMKNGEKIIISRQYVPQIKHAVLGGK
ncbi:LytTR family DNA-binding domain-containing protein [Kineothrix sp. MB12-C1]|uniref:LytTR family DNA-binding domain-containing protein n=1 Tax=Kineothrix sp. MB12-C1 TaxID=3070215 RepID=UPI0027D2E8CE|nr:LytTR family DNA-binding domain-containing protein [Kineothrix sp. MB12-C1]WMC92357.1 LytTR family DNA-binding domain-containing protein [Kineothrix sp. MB12-C1]